MPRPPAHGERRWTRVLLRTAAVAALSAGSVVPAKADEPEPIRIQYEAPAGCSPAAAFAEEVLARTAKARLSRSDESARTFGIVIAAERGAYRGRLVIEDPRAPSAAREVAGETCAEVVSALALISALAIDPNASTATNPVHVPIVGTSRSLPNPTAAVDPRLPGKLLRSEGAPWPADPLPAVLRDADRGEPRWRISVGGYAGGVFAIVAPGTVPTGALFADLRVEGAGWFSPSGRVAVVVAKSQRLEQNQNSASFDLTAGRLDACPLRLALGTDEVAAVPCVSFEAGELLASGFAGLTGIRQSRPWVAAGISGRLEWEILEHFRLEALGGVVFPFVRDTFVFEPSTTVHEVPAVGGFAAGGLALRFP